MPLPFSFSVTREPTGPAAAPVAPPVQNGNFELPITPGGGAGIVLAFAPHTPLSPVFTAAGMNLDVDPLPGTIPQSGFPNGQYYNAASHMPTTHLSSSAMHGNGTPDTTTAHPEVTAHLEQLRNDLFTAATNISALSDRLERLENRPLAQTDLQPQIAALRADIERWICHHLETAVEQSMRRIWERHETASQPATAPVVA